MGYAVGKNNSTNPLRFLMVLASDHITGATGKTVTVTIAKNTGTYATPAGAVTEVGSGIYQLAPNATDANTLGPLLLHATASGCDPTDDQFDIVSYDPFQFSPASIPVGPSATTALKIITDAFEVIGVFSPGEAIPAPDANGALRRLNQMIRQWSLMSLTIPAITREVFPLIAGQGGPSNPYTLGIGGDFDTIRPTMIQNVGIQIDSVSPVFELPRFLYTDDAYASIVQKELTSSYFAGLYFNPTYQSGLATVQVWPVPSNNDSSVVLYRPAQLSEFSSLTAPYDLPPGSEDAIEYGLARRLAKPYGKPWDATLQKDADDYLSIYQRSNTKMVDLGMDAGLIAGTGRYDILSDSTTGFRR